MCGRYGFDSKWLLDAGAVEDPLPRDTKGLRMKEPYPELIAAFKKLKEQVPGLEEEFKGCDAGKRLQMAKRKASTGDKMFAIATQVISNERARKAGEQWMRSKLKCTPCFFLFFFRDSLLLRNPLAPKIGNHPNHQKFRKT